MASTGIIRRATQRLWAGARRAVPGQPTPESHPEVAITAACFTMTQNLPAFSTDESEPHATIAMH